MIREIKIYKSVEDYCKQDLHLNLPSGNQSVWLGAVCPCCGQEQFIQWRWGDSDEILWSDDNCRSARKSIKNKILSEMDDYLKNHFSCVSCCTDLCFIPGYWFSCTQAFERLEYYEDYEDDLKLSLPLGYKRTPYIKYNNEEDKFQNIRFDGYEYAAPYTKFSDYCEEIGIRFAQGLNDDGVYELNSLSRKFCSNADNKESSINVFAELGWINSRGDGLESKRVSIEMIFDLMRFYREYDGLYEDDVKSIIQSETDRLEDTVDVEPIRKELSLDQIKEVLKEMIGFETLIISLQSRMKRLFLVKERENSKYLNISTQKEEDDIKNLEKRMQEFTAERERLSSATLDTEEFVSRISASKPKLNYPTEPNKPVEPQYEKPGLFNKKKVEADNAAKKQQYDAALASYNAALSEYNRLVIEVQKMEKEQQEEIRQEAMILAQEDRKKELADIDAKISDCQTGIETAKSELYRKEKELQTAKDNLSELPWNKEFDQAVELLKKTLEAKIVYEKSEVIFPKYHDLVAYTQFYEYFQAGRCTSLTGPDGAYNLYENELRQNIIIGKLDDISNSLEEIKQNQYMIYSELKSINSNISKLDDSMNKILGKVTEIGTNVEAIRNSTEIMEENSKIAAYYSKKNAELTNAMGYLVALK